MNKVVTWLKANVFIVIFVAVMLAACVALPIIGLRLNEGVRAEVEERASKLTRLRAIEKTQIDLPGSEGESRQVVLNQNLLEQYRRAVEQQLEQANAVFDAALEHNRKGRGVLMPELFPEPPMARREVLPRQFHLQLVDAYDRLLEDIGAGAPPDPEQVKEDLNRRQMQYLSQTLFTENVDSLDEQQRERLRTELRDYRTTLYLRKAQELDVYITPDAVRVPGWDATRQPSLSELFAWQWDYWIYEDVLRAIADVNASAETVVDAPVKRIVVVQLLPGSGITAPAASGSGGGGGGMGPGMGPAAGGMGRRGAGGGGGSSSDGGAAPAMPIDPKAEAPLDYGTSLTGRQTGALYDVRYVDVVLMVDPRRVPDILDAFAARNFMTVTNLRMTQSDPFDALRQGFYYGSGPLAELTIRLETIWLRSWTKQFMPPEVKAALGVPEDPPANPTQGDGDSA